MFHFTLLVENHHICLVLLCAVLPQTEVLRQLHEVVDQLHDPLHLIPKGILEGIGVERRGEVAGSGFTQT